MYGVSNYTVAGRFWVRYFMAEIERIQIYLRGHTDCYAYLKWIDVV